MWWSELLGKAVILFSGFFLHAVRPVCARYLRGLDLRRGLYFSNPYCVIATSVPESIPVGDTLNHHVACDGYFFKRYRYQAGDSWRDAPLLIGHALLDRESTVPDSASSAANWLLPALLMVVAATVLLMVSLNWWFRRGDRRVRAQLETYTPNLWSPVQTVHRNRR